MVHTVESLSRFGFLYQNNRYKLVANQIPHNAGLKAIPYMAENSPTLGIGLVPHPLERVQTVLQRGLENINHSLLNFYKY